jgi:hypothetical protein
MSVWARKGPEIHTASNATSGQIEIEFLTVQRNRSPVKDGTLPSGSAPRSIHAHQVHDLPPITILNFNDIPS